MRPFLRAEWRHLAILNFDVDPALLRCFVPRGTELDTFQDKSYVSVVGFLFRNTKLLGVPVPFHRNFEEVNLRFYVRRKGPEGWRRGVVFVKELVPRAAIAFLARLLYNERYASVPMSHRLERDEDGRIRSVRYGWRFAGREHHMRLAGLAASAPIQDGSVEEFIAEHYWGYSAQRDGSTLEYRVEHPRWAMASASEARLDCDVSQLYGSGFAESLNLPPASAFVADGSAVTVYRGLRLDEV